MTTSRHGPCRRAGCVAALLPLTYAPALSLRLPRLFP